MFNKDKFQSILQDVVDAKDAEAKAVAADAAAQATAQGTATAKSLAVAAAEKSFQDAKDYVDSLNAEGEEPDAVAVQAGNADSTGGDIVGGGDAVATATGGAAPGLAVGQ